MDSLSQVLMNPWLLNSKFARFKRMLAELVEVMSKYHTFLKSQTRRTEAVKLHKEPVRSYHDNWAVEYIKGDSSATVRGEHEKVHDLVKNLSPYDPICINQINLLPDDQYEKRLWLKNLKLPFMIALYTFHHGNFLGNTHFIWRVPDDERDRDFTLQVKTVAKIQEMIPIYSTRAMRKEFLEFGSALKLKPVLLRNMYRFITNDNSASETSEQSALDDRVCEFLLASDDEDLVYDLRKNNGRVKDPKFEPFWTELGKLLDEETAVHERRSTQEHTYLPFAISVADLREQVLKRLPAGTPAPSTSWIRLNFYPSNPYTQSALNYTGQFRVKYAVQQRLLRAQHEDAGFAAHIFHLFKSMAVKWRDWAVVLFVDDKAIIPIGEPELPVSTGVRPHNKSLAVEGTAHRALDHDYHKCGAVASVILDADIPENSRDSFHHGTVHVSLKDKVFQPSSPARHTAENVHILRAEHADDDVTLNQPILFVYSDGGPDHRTTYKSVQLCLVAMFVALDLDLLVAARTAPNQSYANPAERVMATLNLALQNAALARDSMSDGMECRLRSLSTLSAIRGTANKYPGLKDELTASVKPVLDCLQERFSRLKRHDKNFSVHSGHGEEGLNMTTSMLQLIESSSTLEEASKKFTSFPGLQTFFDVHTQARHYTFQVGVQHQC